MKVKKRFFSVLIIFFRIFLAFRKEFKLIKRYGFKVASQKMEKIHYKLANKLYNIAIINGGVLIKLCQYFSTRRDIFPEPYIKVLSKLQDNVPEVPFEEVEKRLNEEYGDYKKIFKEVDKKSLASASLGQVHKAKLHSGETVVIKFLKYQAERMIDIDFAILFYVFRIMSYFNKNKNIDLNSLFNEFTKITGDELNFKREVYILSTLKEKLKKFKYLKIPEVYKEYSTEKVIVMEYCEGIKINEIKDFKALNLDPELISKRIIEIYMEQFLFIKIVHFDPHPGNILIDKDGNIILLDFGMAGFITEKMSNGIKEGLKAFTRRDYRKIIDILYELGFISKNINRYSLLTVMEYFFDEVLETIKLDKESMLSVDIRPIIDDLIELIYTQPFILPYEWAFIGRTVSTLAGIISFLNPDFKFYEEFKPYADRLLNKNLDEAINDIFGEAKKYFEKLYQLPYRIEKLLDDQDRGNLKFKVDLNEVDERLDDLRFTIIKVVSFVFSLFTGIISYTFYVFGYNESFYLFAIISGFSFVFSFFYSTRKNGKKSYINKIKKMY